MIYFLHNEKQFIHHPAKMKKMIPKMGKKLFHYGIILIGYIKNKSLYLHYSAQGWIKKVRLLIYQTIFQKIYLPLLLPIKKLILQTKE